LVVEGTVHTHSPRNGGRRYRHCCDMELEPSGEAEADFVAMMRQ
jgi:hypothetical protein